ncbi:MAG: hypothetical protein V4622_08985 [Bacteroidota bacterium]
MSTFKNKDFYFFLLAVLILDILFHWHEILHVPPLESHLWRQTDSLTTIQSYFYDNTPFFKPHTNDYLDFKRNTTLTEFPILYYISSLFWSFTGEVYWVPRLLNLLVTLIGAYGLFKITLFYTKSLFAGFLSILFLFSSPTFSIYAISFIPNVPALGLVFYSWYQAVNYYENKKKSSLYVACLSICLAGLLKITLSISLVVFILISLYLFWKKKIDKKEFIKIQTLLFTSILLIFSWVLYLKSYNQNSASHSLFETFSIFSHTFEEFKQISNKSFWENVTLLEYKYFYILFIIICLYNYFQVFRRKNVVLGLIHILYLGGLIIYTSLFCFSFVNHEYYLLDYIPLIILHVITFLYFIRDLKQVKYIKLVLLGLGLFFFSNSVAHVISKHFEATSPFKKVLTKNLSKSDQDFYDYYRFVSGDRINLYTYREDLKKLKITRKDKVIVLPDNSPNSPLYFLNLRGVTNYQIYIDDNFSNTVKKCHEMGYNYLIIFNKADSSLANAVSTVENKKLILDKEHVFIYKLN